MKIELQSPYKEIWKAGYVVINREKRRTLLLVNTRSDRSSCSYARYLMAVKLGRFLTEHEHVDHIDNDKTNDSLDNLQILSQRENSIKSAAPKIYVEFRCPICGSSFELEKRQSH